MSSRTWTSASPRSPRTALVKRNAELPRSEYMDRFHDGLSQQEIDQHKDRAAEADRALQERLHMPSSSVKPTGRSSSYSPMPLPLRSTSRVGSADYRTPRSAAAGSTHSPEDLTSLLSRLDALEAQSAENRQLKERVDTLEVKCMRHESVIDAQQASITRLESNVVRLTEHVQSSETLARVIQDSKVESTPPKRAPAAQVPKPVKQELPPGPPTPAPAAAPAPQNTETEARTKAETPEPPANDAPPAAPAAAPTPPSSSVDEGGTKAATVATPPPAGPPPSADDAPPAAPAASPPAAAAPAPPQEAETETKAETSEPPAKGAPPAAPAAAPAAPATSADEGGTNTSAEPPAATPPGPPAPAAAPPGPPAAGDDGPPPGLSKLQEMKWRRQQAKKKKTGAVK